MHSACDHGAVLAFARTVGVMTDDGLETFRCRIYPAFAGYGEDVTCPEAIARYWANRCEACRGWSWGRMCGEACSACGGTAQVRS